MHSIPQRGIAIVTLYQLWVNIRRQIGRNVPGKKACGMQWQNLYPDPVIYKF